MADRLTALVSAALLVLGLGLSSPPASSAAAQASAQASAQTDSQLPAQRGLRALIRHLSDELQALVQGEEADPRRIERLADQLARRLRAQSQVLAKHIARHHLAEVIARRQAAWEGLIEGELDALSAAVSELLAALDADAQRRAAQTVLARLSRFLDAHSSLLDARNLEANATPEDTLTPLTPSGLDPQALDTTVGPLTDPAPYLAEAEEIPLTPEIRALAASLDNSPVALYSWVRNHIEYVPSAGSIQGAAGTLATRRGNDTDSASLLIALLRAAGIPARYAFGTQRLGVESLYRVLGGLSSPQAVSSLLAQGGAVHSLVVEGGRIVAFDIQRTWVEAWLDFYPSRGAVQRTGDSWVALDPAYKLYAPIEGSPWREIIQLDSQDLLSQIQQYSEADPAAGWIANLDDQSVDSAQAVYAQLLPQTLDSPEGASAADLLGTQELIELQVPVLAAGLPYALQERFGAAAALPEGLRHHLEVRLYENDALYAAASPLIERDFSLAALAGHRLSLRGVPASEADAEALASFLREDPPAAELSLDALVRYLPGYLIELRLQLRLDGQPIAESAPVSLGQALRGELIHTAPQLGEHRYPWHPVAGEQLQLGWDLQGGLASAMMDADARLQGADAAPPEQLPAALLQAGLTGYLYANDQYNRLQAAIARAAVYRAPSFAACGTVLETDLLFGLPRSVYLAGIGLDVAHLDVQAADNAGDPQRTARLIRQTGQLGAELARAALEGLLAGQEPGVSAPRAQAAALDQGLRLYTLEADTVDQILPLLDIDPATAETARNAALAGRRVILSQAPVTLGSAWSGVGLSAADPQSGRGDYRVLGGQLAPRELTAERQGAIAALLFQLALAPDLDPSPLQATATAELAAPQRWSAGLAQTGDPLQQPLSDSLYGLVAGSWIDLAYADQLDPVLGDQLWGGLLSDETAPSRLSDPEPPSLVLSASPDTLALGDPLLIHAEAADNTAVINLSVSLDGLPLTLDANGDLSLSLDAAGLHTLAASATDSAGNRTDRTLTLTVTDPSDQDAPQIHFLGLAYGDQVTAPTPIVIDVTDPHLARWALTYRPLDGSAKTPVASGNSAVTAQAVYQLDPTQLINGLYELELTAQDLNGYVSVDTLVLRVTGEMKVGHFAFTLEDLKLPMAGIDVQVTRTYDTRQRNQHLDFGYGWSVGYQNVRLSESRIPGSDWQMNVYPGIVIGEYELKYYCVEPTGGRLPLIAARLPSGELESFQMDVEPHCNLGTPIDAVTPVYKPMAGTHTTLENLDVAQLHYNGGELLDILGTVEAMDPSNYRLTDVDGTVYDIDQRFGLRRVADIDGHTLTFSRDGVEHSSGARIDFTRDGQGRITRITDPLGNPIDYAYDAQGNLSRVADQLGHDVTYAYIRDHFLAETRGEGDKLLARTEYDADGRLIAITDAAGHRSTLDHDIAGRLETLTDRLGHTRTYVYDEAGRIIAETDPLGRTTSHTYDGEGHELSRTDPLGHTTSWAYDAKGNKLSETDALGHTTAWTYNAHGHVLTQTDPLGQVVTQDYDPDDGRLLSLTNADGYRFEREYDDANNLAALIDPLGRATRYVYDLNDRLIRQTAPVGAVTTYSYDANGHKLSETLTRTDETGTPVEQTQRWVYDATGNVTEQIDALGHSTRMEYDSQGRETAVIDPAGRRTEYEYDANGNKVLTRYADGSTETQTYDAENRLVSQTDALGRNTTYEYDAAGQRIAIVFPDGSRTESTYDPAGRLIESTDENGHTTQYAYDAAGRQTRVTDALGHQSTFTYDALGQLTERTDALGHTTTYAYDGQGRRTRTDLPDGTETRTEHDALGNPVAEIDQAGTRVERAYDAAGRLIRVTDPLGGITRFTFDEAGNQLTQTDANSHTTRWAYDSLGRPIAHTLPLGQTETFDYDALGNLIAQTDFNGQTTTYDYDSLDRLIGTRYADGRIETFAYDATGQRISATDPSGIQTQSYDPRGRLIRETKAEGGEIEYQYDPAGNRTLVLTTLNGQVYEQYYAYDALDRLAQVIDAQGGETTYGYDAVGNRARIDYPNGTTQLYRYDALNRLTRLETRCPADQLLAAYDYSLHPTGLRLGVTELGGRQVAYQYDAAYRLTQETIDNPDGARIVNQYQYDPVGNRLYSIEAGMHTAYSYDANDQLLQSGGEHYAYDNNGATRSVTVDGVATEYRYDARGQLIQAQRQGVTQNRYSYDVDGNRTQVIHDGVATRYLVDGNQVHAQVLFETDANGNPLVAYTYGDDLISQARQGATHYYHYDGHGSTRALSDAQGSVTDSYRFDAFGQLLDSQGETANDYLYAGEQYDPSLGQYYLRARYYNPATGRFLTRDDFQGWEHDPVTLHKYLYANADPVSFTDPSGRFGMGGLAGQMLSIGLRISMRGLRIANAAFTLNDMADLLMGNKELSLKDAVWYMVENLGFRAAGRLLKFSKRFLRQCSRNSFIQGTLVHTEQGLRPIEQIQIGDKVWSYDEATGEASYQAVTHLIQGDKEYRLIDVELEDGSRIEATEGHPFYVDGKWKEAKDLTVGDEIRTSDGGTVLVASLESKTETRAVYNLSVERGHSYYVGDEGVLVHNSALKCSLDFENLPGGSWERVVENMSERARKYQEQITGRIGKSFLVDGVKFDGVDITRGALLDAKGPGYAKFIENGAFKDWWGGAEELVKQARRQLRVAGGVPIEWHVAEAEAVRVIRATLARSGISGISILHVLPKF